MNSYKSQGRSGTSRSLLGVHCKIFHMSSSLGDLSVIWEPNGATRNFAVTSELRSPH